MNGRPTPSDRGAIRKEVSALLFLSGPLVAGQLAAMASSFIDTVMAGRLGPEALGAVAVGMSVFMSLTLTVSGVLMAISPSVAQFRGADSYGEIGPLTRQGFWIALALGAVGFVALRSLRPLLELVGVTEALIPLITSYLAAASWGFPALCGYFALRFMSEGLAITRPAMYFGLVGVAVNIVGNFALMFGYWGFPNLGVTGCGYSTAIAVWVQFLGLALYVVTSDSYRSSRIFERFDAPDRRQILEVLRVGGPIAGAIFVESSLFSSVSLLLATLGPLSIAAHQIAINFAGIAFMVPLGLSMGITVRVGHARGRGDLEGVRRAGLVGMGVALVAQSVSAAWMIVFPRFIVGLYTDDPTVGEAAVGLLFLAAIFQLSDGLQVSASGALRGLKDTRIPMWVTVIAYWVVGLPLGYSLGFHLGLGARGMWTGLIAGLTVAAVLLSWRFIRLTDSAK